MRVVAFLNQKGGVGKTSCCFHLAGALAKAGKSVLLLDNDPQASLTQLFFGPEATEQIPVEATIAVVYSGEVFPGRAIRRTPVAGIDLVPGSWALGDRNVGRPEAADPLAQSSLSDFLDQVGQDALTRYDLALVDCPPNLHLCSWAALLAADSVVIPAQPEDLGVQGLKPVLELLGLARARNPRLALAGYLITMFVERTRLHRRFEASLRELCGTDVFDDVLPRSIEFSTSVNLRLPATHHLPGGLAAEACVAVAAELLARLERRAS